METVQLLLIFLVLITFLFVGDTVITLLVYGKFLPEDEAFEFVNRYINETQLNAYNDRILSLSDVSFDLPFIAKTASILPIYYIDRYGTVYPFGKTHALIKQRFAELRPEKKSLKNLKSL